ncbi:glutamine-dependent NAD(+) synthetase [Chytridiales sp. JEL 0842]|nr:glutamine-dependent NAD(+) synthetase [Chytridiales sp. JEL 0842]
MPARVCRSATAKSYSAMPPTLNSKPPSSQASSGPESPQSPPPTDFKIPTPPPPPRSTFGLWERVRQNIKKEEDSLDAPAAPKEPVADQGNFLTRLDEKLSKERKELEEAALAKNDSKAKTTAKVSRAMDKYMNVEANYKERDRLLHEAFKEGHWEDSKEIARVGDKLWEAPRSLTSTKKAFTIPNISGKTLAGEKTSVLNMVEGQKASLVCFFFTAFGEAHAKSYIEPFEKEFKGVEGVKLVRVNVEEIWTRHWLLKLVVPWIRLKVSAENRANYLMHYGDIKQVRRAVGMTNRLVGWANLVDSNGKIRWQAHGPAKEHEIETLIAGTKQNQWALDFEGNLARILESIRRAKALGATYRLGPELEICGYGCNDHYLELDTEQHCWEVVVELLKSEVCKGIVVDVGMPVMHKNTLYNCRLIFLDGKILLIRPKMHMANDGNYRELRWFTPWMRPKEVEKFVLPEGVRAVAGQRDCVFGDGVLEFLDTSVGTELCEELFTPRSPHIDMALDGVEIFTNGSGSHHEFGKLHKRVDLIRGATSKSGGIYLYANQHGCDGERTYYDGCALIVVNGEVVAQGPQFTLSEVQVLVATVDLGAVRTQRGSVSRSFQAALQGQAGGSFPRVEVGRKLGEGGFVGDKLTEVVGVKYLRPSEEIRYGPACWLWDYLRRSKGCGFLLPLSGGIDSCSTALIVFSMCNLVCTAIERGDKQVLQDARRVAGLPDSDPYTPTSPTEFCHRIFHTAYLGTKNSSNSTRQRAKDLAAKIGSYHIDLDMDGIVESVLTVFETVTGKRPIYKIFGGSNTENLALQNIQARSRMVLSYTLAQLLPWHRGRTSGSLLVLGSANVDETLRGYFTKYDCSSADLNPIGGISKKDLRGFVAHMKDAFGLEVLDGFLHATPTAELEPITEGYVQSDEVDMGMSYDDLSVYGTLRKVARCGPVRMFTSLLGTWGSIFSPSQIAEKVKKFFFYYSINRHKTTILPPSYHMSPYSPDDNRYDLRPILYNSGWNWQFRKIDVLAKEVEERNAN